mmetsp:Transcript_10477/g.20808  ORF Transcript_10477/g.20808 Transcript_10477/m.20808 type:complete len:700 (-) Transcript_10477:147-2246(-)
MMAGKEPTVVVATPIGVPHQIQVVVPPGAVPGSTLRVPANGILVDVLLPEGTAPGQVLLVNVPADDGGFEAYIPLKTANFDITPTCARVCCVTEKLVMGDQQLVYRKKYPCGVSTMRRPYAQLGEVIKIDNCCNASILVPDMMGVQPQVGPNGEMRQQQVGGWSPGCCGNIGLVNEIVGELEDRKAKRGHAAQSAKLDGLLAQVVDLRASLTSLTKASSEASAAGYAEKVPVSGLDAVLNLTPLPYQEFSTLNYCIYFTPACLMVLALGVFETLKLLPEEVVTESGNCMGRMERKREYANMGFIKRNKVCVCCRQISWENAMIMPGFPCCNKGKTLQIMAALRQRMARRGTVGQIKKHEALVPQLEEALRAMDALAGGTPGSASAAAAKGKGDPGGGGAPGQAMVMDRGFTEFEDKEYDMTNKCDALAGCLLTCGVAGCERETLKLTQNMVTVTEKSNLDDAEMELDYAQLDSVDVSKTNCCFYTVNEQSPGWGCDQRKVLEVAEELQKRKMERGNVAQLGQLEHMLALATALEGRALELAGSSGAQVPPKGAPFHADPVQAFEPKRYDFSDPCESLATCYASCGLAGPTTTRTINLTHEEMEVNVSNWCCESTSRVPYASLDGVDVDEACCGACLSVDDVGSASCGCGNGVLREVVAELGPRIEKRGNIAQLKLQDNLNQAVRHVNAATRALKQAKGL